MTFTAKGGKDSQLAEFDLNKVRSVFNVLVHEYGATVPGKV